MNEKLVNVESDEDGPRRSGSRRVASRGASEQAPKPKPKLVVSLSRRSSRRSEANIDLERGITLSVSNLMQSSGSQQNGASNQEQQQQQQVFKLSPMRWSILIGFCVYGYCNGIVSITQQHTFRTKHSTDRPTD